MNKQARKYLIEVLDTRFDFNSRPCDFIRTSARLGPPERALHCPPRTTSKNKATRERVLYR